MGVSIDHLIHDLNHSHLQWIFGQNFVLQQDVVQMAIQKHFFNQLCDKPIASSNTDQNDTVFGLDNLYVVYLMEKNGEHINYNISGHMKEYRHSRKVACKSQWNF